MCKRPSGKASCMVINGYRKCLMGLELVNMGKMG